LSGDIINISDFFKNLMQKSKHDMLDVTDKYKNILPMQIGSILNINSDYLDVRLNYSISDFALKVFLKNEEDWKNLIIEYQDTPKETFFSLFSSKTSISGYIEFFIPSCNLININTKDCSVNLMSVEIDNIKVHTSTGDIYLYNIKTNLAKLKTNEGDILLEIPKNIYKLKLKTKYGDISKQSIKSIPSSDATIKCETETGDITVIGI